MLIRCKGYNTGAQEYLEEGVKEGREFSRDELDERVMLDGDLDLTRMIYDSIPDKGQERYLSFTMGFKEDHVSYDTLHALTTEFKQFMMYAYKDDEFNFYAEAHLPKIKHIRDKKTGEMIERKPHIHIIIPRKNLLSGNEANPVGIYTSNEKYFEAFQEYLNQKYNLASPRENIRFDPKDAASVLSRYKGDDFYGKNREFKQNLVKQVIDSNVTSRTDFYALVASYGETRVRNEGKPNEYIAVKLPDDAKFTNLKDTIFQDDFIVQRQLKKPPLDKGIIEERLQAWPRRAKELKYVEKATPAFRERYFKQSNNAERAQLLIERENAFYQKYGDPYDSELHTIERKGNHQRSADETGAQRSAETASGLQDLPVSDVAANRQTGSAGSTDSALLLPGHAHLHLGQPEPRGDLGLRPPVRTGRGREGRPEQTSGRSGRYPAVPEATGTRAGTVGAGAGTGRRRAPAPRTGDVIPPYALNPYRVATVADIEARGQRLFDPLKRPVDSELVISLATAIDPGGSGSPEPPRVDPATEEVKQKRQRKSRSNTNKTRNIPPYALNPHRVATISDIEKRGQRLFDPLKRPVDSELVMKLATIKPVAVNRSASTVAAYFNRQIEQNQLLPAQRKAVQRVNKQFFELRRSISSDDRLTKQDKAQLVSVLTFERMKAREAIQNPGLHKEATYMGSAEIRKLVNPVPEEDTPEFSISGPASNSSTPIRDRVKRVIKNFALQVDENVSQERERELSAKDIYTKKSRFSQNVHYLDKTSDKTLFVDTGTAIAMRRTGITEAGVGVALQLATQRFGSTLTINGNAEFKHLVVEAAAKGNMDIHFTDKHMNQALTLRRAELAIEHEGQQITPPDVAERESAGPEATGEQQAPAERTQPAAPDKTLIVGELLEHGAAPYKHDEKNESSYFVALQTEAGPRTVWGIGLQEVMQEKDFAQGDTINLKDEGKQPVTIQERQEDGSVKEKPGFRRVWSAELETTVSTTPTNADRAAKTATTEQPVSVPQTVEEVRPLVAIEARSEAFKDVVEAVGIEEAQSQVTPQVARDWVSADVKDMDALQGPSLKALAVEVISENITNAPQYGVELQVQAPEINAQVIERAVIPGTDTGESAVADPAPSIEVAEPPAAPKAPSVQSTAAAPASVVSPPAIAPEVKAPTAPVATVIASASPGPIVITPKIETALVNEWVTNQRELLNQRVEMEGTVRVELVSALSGKRGELKEENSAENQSKPFAERLAAMVGLGYGVNDHAIMQLNSAMRELSRKTGEPHSGREPFIETATTQREWDEYAINTWKGAVGMSNHEDSIKPLAAWMQEQVKTRVTPEGELLPAQPKPALSQESMDRLSVERAERIGKIVEDVTSSNVDYRSIAKIAFSEVGESLQSLQRESTVSDLDQSSSAKTVLDTVLDKPALAEPQSHTAALSEPEEDHGPEMD